MGTKYNGNPVLTNFEIFPAFSGETQDIIWKHGFASPQAIELVAYGYGPIPGLTSILNAAEEPNVRPRLK